MKFFEKQLTTLGIAILLCLLLDTISTFLVPTLTNDLAMDQMLNSDINFIVMSNWNKVVQGIETLKVVIMGSWFISLFIDTIKWLFNKGEEE